MREYRIRLAARDYSIFLSDNDVMGEMPSAERAIKIDLLGEYDAIADSIGRRRVDSEAAKLLVSAFLRDMRGYPSAEYSLLLFGEGIELNICDTKNGNIIYSAPDCRELSYKTVALQDGVELTLCTALIADKRIRIYGAQNIESVSTELLKRLKMVKGLSDADYAIAVDRADGGARFKCSESDAPSLAYLLPVLYFSLRAGDVVHDVVGNCKITLAEGNRLFIPYGWY